MANAIILQKNAPETFSTIFKTLSDNRCVILPCDTIYGIVGQVDGSAAAIRQIKGREAKKPFIQLLASIDELNKKSAQSIPVALLELLPASLTMIVESKDGAKTAFRVPDDPFLRLLLTQLSCPLYSTSVNKSGMPALNSVNEIYAAFAKDVDYIVEETIAAVHGKPLPSTIVDISVKPYKIIRQGGFVLPKDLN